MVRRWLWVGMFTVCSVAMGQVTGRLEGWFVTEEGVPFFMAVTVPMECVTLRPVWGHYTLTLSVRAPAPMREVAVFNRWGQKVWQQAVAPPRRTVTVPPNPLVPLRVHASDGFTFRLAARLADGRRWTEDLTIPLRPLHSLRIDWLQLLACLEAQRLLYRYGTLLRPYLSRHPVAFRLIGANGALVWEHRRLLPADHPISLALLPAGKTGWQPKQALLPAERFGGYTTEEDGTMVATLWSSPLWACRHPTAFASRFANATLSVYLALHEGLHALTLRDIQEKKMPPITVPLERVADWLVSQWLESKALDEAVKALDDSDETAATEWMWAFLYFREGRRALWGRYRATFSRWEQTVEWAENIAHWGALTILKQPDATKSRAIPYLEADPTVAEYADENALEWLKGQVQKNDDDLCLDVVRFYSVGAVLNGLMSGEGEEDIPLWLRRAFQGEQLEKLLAEATGYSAASLQKRREVVAQRANALRTLAGSLREQLRKFLSPQPVTPTLLVHADEGPKVHIHAESGGRLAGLTLEWKHAGLTVSVQAPGHLWWRDQKTFVITVPSDRPNLIARYRDQLTAWFGATVHLHWQRTDTEAIVKVGDRRWQWGKSVHLPDFCPPDGWFALREGDRWLWLKAAVQGGLQLFAAGGVRFTEVPMMPAPLAAQKGEGIAVRFSPTQLAALTLFAPAEAFFVVRTTDGSRRLQRLQVVTHQIGERKSVSLVRAAVNPTNELTLTVPLQPRWSLKSEGEDERLVWSVIWGHREIAWSPFGALHEVNITTDRGKESLAFLTGVLTPMVQAVKVRVHELLPPELRYEFRYRPLAGTHVAVFYCLSDRPDSHWRWKVAEGETDASGTTVLLRPFAFGGFGAFWQTLAERPDWDCRNARATAVWTFHELPANLPVETVSFTLAPHETVVPIEFVRRRPDGREEPAGVGVTVMRLFHPGDKRVLSRTRVEGKMTLKIPTLPHGLGPPWPSDHFLWLQVRDNLTGVQRTVEGAVGVHDVSLMLPDGQERYLVGPNNAPVRILLPAAP